MCAFGAVSVACLVSMKSVVGELWYALLVLWSLMVILVVKVVVVEVQVVVVLVVVVVVVVVMVMVVVVTSVTVHSVCSLSVPVLWLLGWY